MKIERFLSLALAMTSSLPVEAQVPEHIEVFTDARHPVATATHRGIVIYRLDAIKHFEQTLSAGLPADIEAAKREASDRVQRIGHTATAELKRAHAGLLKARRYGLDHYPAIVFDDEAVVYGVTHINAALFHYRLWRQQQAVGSP